MTDSEAEQIKNIYFDIEKGLSSAKQIYQKLNKKIKLKTINEVLNLIKNKQIKKQNIEKKYIPIVSKKDSYQGDLMFYSQFKKLNAGNHVILNIINMNTRKLFSYIMKDKKSETIIKYFNKFLKDIDYNINILETDAGLEFINNKFKKICQDNNIELVLFNKSDSHNALSIVERVNKTLRNLIDEYMISYNTKKYFNVLDKLVNNYNNRIHTTINMKPNDVNSDDENNIINKNMIRYNEVKADINHNFNIGDKVRLLKIRKTFSKGAAETYSKKIYDIINIKDNKYIVKSDNIIKNVLPYQMLKIDKNIIENPYLNKNIDKQQKEKTILKKDKADKKQMRKIKKENLDIIPKKVKKLNVLEMRPVKKINYKE